MHELAIAVSLAESLIKYMKENAVKVKTANLCVGPFSGIDPEALKFAWEPALANFPGGGLEGCRLKIRMAKVKHSCRSCGGKFEFEDWQIKCPSCGRESLHRESGNEFILESAEIEDV
jgi:hydrogenase nickel insertion protein HypA